MARARSKNERLREVELWHASGESALHFSSSRDYSDSSLARWAAGVRRAEANEPRFVRLEVASEESSALVVEVGSARLLVGPGFDRQLLRDVVAALAEQT